jgi:hypothetical protein
MTFKVMRYGYIEPSLSAGKQRETLNRSQGNPSDLSVIDSLSPGFMRQYQWMRPGLRLIRNSDKMELSIGMQTEIGTTSNSLNHDGYINTNHFYFTPDFSWELEYKTGRRIRAHYQTLINVPDANQLLPVVNNSNPLILNTGNRSLKPEINYDLSLNWWIFDQFSFTTLMTNLDMVYTRDKINWERSVDATLRQNLVLTNVADDYRISGGADFSTPVRSLGIKINTNFEETWNRGLNFINDVENINTNFIHKLSVSIENRTKTKADIIVGGSLQITDAKFSIQESLNNRYSDFSYFTEMRYNPDKHLNFQLTAEITQYNSQSFSKSITIPLIGAEASYYFMKNNRGSFTLSGTDLLNRNTGIERSSELNYLRERRSNMLGRFFMFSFKYKLNKFGKATGGIDVKINRR